LDGSDDYTTGQEREDTGLSIKAGRIWLYDTNDRIQGRDFDVVSGGLMSNGQIEGEERVRITDRSDAGGSSDRADEAALQERLYAALPDQKCFASPDETPEEARWRLSNWTVRMIGG